VNSIYPDLILRSPDKTVDLSKPVVMAIINTTPDSFYLGSRYKDAQAIVDKVGEAVELGARMIDMGGMSSRPGAEVISPQEEIDRLLPGLEAIRKHFADLWISIDSWRSAVISACIPYRIDLVNDISGGRYDPGLWPIVAESRLPYVLMHMPNPLNAMHENQHYDDIIRAVGVYFHESIRELTAVGVQDIIVDPGFGFGKSLEDNYRLLGGMDQLHFLGKPMLAGVSRKSMIQKVLSVPAGEALNGTTALNMIALSKGARILRVHDVREAVQCVQLHARLTTEGNE